MDSHLYILDSWYYSVEPRGSAVAVVGWTYDNDSPITFREFDSEDVAEGYLLALSDLGAEEGVL
jgi:hypothetical protein